MSGSRGSLDDFMRAMWVKFGKPGGTREGYVDHPYSITDVEQTLTEVSGDRVFASDFVYRYIQGRGIADYEHLLDRAGLVVRKRAPGRAWLGDISFVGGRSLVANLVDPIWPVYAAGLDQDDELQWVNGLRLRSGADLTTVLSRHRPGTRRPPPRAFPRPARRSDLARRQRRERADIGDITDPTRQSAARAARFRARSPEAEGRKA